MILKILNLVFRFLFSFAHIVFDVVHMCTHMFEVRLKILIVASQAISLKVIYLFLVFSTFLFFLRLQFSNFRQSASYVYFCNQNVFVFEDYSFNRSFLCAKFTVSSDACIEFNVCRQLLRISAFYIINLFVFAIKIVTFLIALKRSL